MDETNRQLLTYLGTHSPASAGELAALVGLTIPSIRYRLFQLMAKGVIGQKKTRNHRVWFFITEKEAASYGNKMNGGGAGIPARRYGNNDDFDSEQ
jgi:predicted ArsR family transcriptional regulator